MKVNSLVLGGDLRKKLADCAVGESETVMVTITPTSVSDGEIQATISGIEYDEPDEPAPIPKGPKKPKGPKALMDAIEA